jgi:diguanylate cyclase (GGDEF)-like protein
VLRREDDALLAEACDLLAQAGFAVTTQHKDYGVLHRLLEARYHTVVLDADAVGMNLVTLVRQVMRIRGAGDTIVITTGDAPWVETAQLLALDGQEVMLRPFAADALVEAVTRGVLSPNNGLSAEPSDFATYRAHICRILQIMTDSMASNTYEDALKALATNLRQVFPSRAVGILDTTGGDGIVYVSTPETAAGMPVGRRLATALRQRYESLCGRRLNPATLQERIEADPSSVEVLVGADTGTDLLLPLLGKGDVCGVLGFSNLTEADYRDGNLPLVHLLASRLHPVLSALVLLKHMAFRDGLTGLYNRTHMEDAITMALEQCQRYGRGFSVVLLDIDSLKQINDELGHQAGDHLLRDFSRLLLSVTRASDTVGRLGGDEFLLLLSDTQAEGLRSFLNRLFVAISSRSLLWNSRHHPMRASVGATFVDERSAPALTPADVIARSDMAMYTAKRRGRACWTVWDDDVGTVANRGPSVTAATSAD